MYVPYYEFIEPWRFTLRIRPNMITHYKPVDFELEKESAELESYLRQHKIAGIAQKTIYGGSYSWKTKKKILILSEAGNILTAQCLQQRLQKYLQINNFQITI
jgi:hypothetical protein